MNDVCHFLADFFVVLLISVLWLCVCKILESVGCDFVTVTVSDRSNIVVVDAAYRPVAPCLLIFPIFSSNLKSAPYTKVRVIVQKLRYMLLRSPCTQEKMRM
jgi:hypothetical protein